MCCLPEVYNEKVFGMPIKTLGSLEKIKVGQEAGNTPFIFFGPKDSDEIIKCDEGKYIIHT